MFIGKKPTAAPLTSSDVADGIITSAKIADGTIVNADVNASAAIVASKLSGAGISVAQTFRLSASATGTQTPIASNWEAVDTDSGGAIGSAMSESSGIFTFPSTGIYYISTFASVSYTGSGRYTRLDLETTTDNSSYDVASQSYTHINNVASTTFANMKCDFIFDVTSTSTHKARLSFTPVDENISILGTTAQNQTAITFIRLGDT
jgi:hypothetical protein